LDGAFRVGPWLVEPSLNTISRNGTAVHLEPKVMKVLVCLVQHAGESLSKEKLLQEVWPGTFVTDDALKRCILELRRVFQDDAREPRVIQTIAKRGYRLVAPVELTDEVGHVPVPSPSANDSREGVTGARKWRARAVTLGGVVSLLILSTVLNLGGIRERLLGRSGIPTIRSLAVLPLQNLSADPAQEYFSDGMTDALITDLAQIESLKVISRTSTVQYKGTKKPLSEIARELNVDGIVEGTVQRSGDRVRITAQLIYGPSDKHLWANSYERDARDLFALERDVTEDISRQIEARILTQTHAPLARLRPANSRAFDAYLAGIYHLSRAGHGMVDEELNKAAEYFQQAIDADPNFAPAYLGMSDARGSHMRNSIEGATASKRAAEKALELDPSSSQAWETLASFKLYYSWDWAGAEEDFRQALELNPNNANAHDGLSQVLYAEGRVDAAWDESQIAQELDPNQNRLSLGLNFRREYDRQIELLQRWVEHHPDDGDAYGDLYGAYVLMGKPREAIEALERAVTLFGFRDDAARIRRAYGISGYEAAIRVYAKTLERLDATKQTFLPGYTAEAYATVGDKDRAFYWLEQAYVHRDLDGREPGLLFIKVDPMLDSLRSDPRFKNLLRRVGLPP
jgi:TolB-like protein/DNA-binding winged helix-turn-helix (wHTH) protein/thioredoxin-like negative regulator of GroEL